MGQLVNLTGISNADPRARTAREFRYAQGAATGGSNSRPIVLVGNKTSVGTETVETINGPILNPVDCYARFGQRSEITQQYRAAVRVAPGATYYGVAMAEGNSATPASMSWSFVTTADQVSTAQMVWAYKTIQCSVSVGDAGATIATNLAAQVNADPDVPFTAAVGTGSTTIASGSNSQALPQGTINVASTAGFPTSGQILVGTLNTLVNYTGVTGTTFTGCTGGAGTMLTGQTVTNTSQITFTMANNGPRGSYIANRIRVSFVTSVATSVTQGLLTVGTVADSCANANAAIGQRGDLYYHAPACTAIGTVNSTDGGVGQYITWIRSQSAPAIGFDCQVHFGLDTTQSNATAVATSSAANAVRAAFWHVKNNDYSPPMVGAIGAAVKWIKETAYPAASLRGFTTNDTYTFPIPPPYVSSDRLTSTEIIADLNNGVTPIDFSPTGAAVLNRQIGSYNVLPGTSTKDYRAREGHIASVEDAAWEYLEQRWLGIRQDMVTDDPPAGQRPQKGFNTPGSLRGLVFSAIDVLSNGADPDNPWGLAILDPSKVNEMKASVYVEARAAGFGISVNWQPARHDLQDDFLVLQGGPQY